MNYIEPPRTIMEVYKSLPEGTLAELVNGSIVMSPAPSVDHQTIIGEVFGEMRNFIRQNKLGRIQMSPCDIYLDDQQNAVQPDVLFISNDNRETKKVKSGFIGAPDLVVEVLSPGNLNHDLVTKKDSTNASV